MLFCRGQLACHKPIRPCGWSRPSRAGERSSRRGNLQAQGGNGRYAGGNLQHPGQTTERRAELANSQYPFATVVSCSDSRVPPEIVFDQGLGDLFVVRVAGNVIDDHGLGSIEYSVDHLGVRLIVVLGHQSCGAVKAARETIAARSKAPGHIQSLVTAIQAGSRGHGES